MNERARDARRATSGGGRRREAERTRGWPKIADESLADATCQTRTAHICSNALTSATCSVTQFRRSVQDVLQPHHDDHFLLRWLRARKWDPTAAEKMLRDSLDWRKHWDADSLSEWELPQIVKSYFPYGLSGFDKDGAPVIIVPFAGMDMYGILHVITQKEFVKVTIKILDQFLKLARDQSKKHGQVANQVTVIFDMEGFNLKQYLWRPAGELVLTLIQMYEANYPEILKTCFIINAPRVFAFAFSITKKFMNEYTLSKIQIYKADPPKWQAAILKIIPKDQLPVHFGGTLCDPDGNPRLTSKICQGGKVPKEMYINNMDKLNEDYTTVVVRKGRKLELDISTPEKGSILSWEFRSEGHDIKFGILKKDAANGTQTEVIPIRRVASHQSDEVGVLTCEDPATYSIIFDNTYSYIRNKKVHYSVRVLPPAAELKKMTTIA